MIVRGKVSDRAVVLITKNGDRIVCREPNRLGVQSKLPWLDHEGDREWNISPVRVMEDFETGKYYASGKFIVGKWGTSYNSPDFMCSVSLKDIKALEELLDANEAFKHKVACAAGREQDYWEAKAR
jgi:hypothetical protein